MPWRCQLAQIYYWINDADAGTLTAYQVDEHGQPTFEVARLNCADLEVHTSHYACQNCGIDFGLWASVQEHLEHDWHQDGRRSRWEGSEL